MKIAGVSEMFSASILRADKLYLSTLKKKKKAKVYKFIPNDTASYPNR
jgi:hypothetical protein